MRLREDCSQPRPFLVTAGVATLPCDGIEKRTGVAKRMPSGGSPFADRQSSRSVERRWGPNAAGPRSRQPAVPVVGATVVKAEGLLPDDAAAAMPAAATPASATQTIGGKPSI